SDCDNPPVRGELRALAATGGLELGRQYFVPPDHVGGGLWNSPALSPDGRFLVVATGEDNEYPDDPFTRAMLVLDPQTLDILAADRQGLPDDDEDWGTTPIIFHDAQGRTLVGANHKNGWFYAYDLDNV